MSKNLFAEKESGVRFSFWLEGDEQADYQIAAFKVEEKLFSLTKIEVLVKISSSLLGSAERLGKQAGLRIAASGLNAITEFSGIVTEAAEFFENGEVISRFVLLPALALLAQQKRVRIFQDVTVPDIVETLLCEHGIADALWQLEGNFAARGFCMQYEESDLAFVNRILAEENIFYYFVHEDKGRQRLVLCNALRRLLECPNGGRLRHDGSFARAAAGLGGGAEIYCHALRRNFSSAYAERQTGGAALSGLAYLPLPLCGHKLALQSPLDSSLNAPWYLTSVRHEGIAGGSGLSSGDLAEYFTGGLAAAGSAYAESALAGGAFGAASPLPQQSRAAGAARQADALADTSPYGVPHHGGVAGAAHNVISMQNLGHGAGRERRAGGVSSRPSVYACAFTAVDGASPYQPPLSARPLPAGPLAAQLIRTDKTMGRYELALQTESGGRADNARFWVQADTALGQAVAAFADKAGAVPAAPLLLEFLAGNPDRPVISSGFAPAAANAGALAGGDGRGNAAVWPVLSGAAAAGLGQIKAQAGFDDAAFDGRAKQALNAAPWGEEKRQKNGLSAGSSYAAGSYPYMPHYAAQILPRFDAAQTAAGQNFIHLASGAYNAASSGGRGQSGAVIPLAQMQADLKNSAAANAQRPDYAALSGRQFAAGSRFLEVEEHQRQDIHGIYELNCDEKFLCRTKALHINAGDRLVLRGPGGRIIIDKYSMTLEAPIIRLKGRLAAEEDVFDRQEGVKAAIRDELPLVADCSGKTSDDGLN